MADPLRDLRESIDEVDDRILDLLQQRGQLAAEVVERKRREGLPIFVPRREEEKVASFREAAAARKIDPEWAEDFLRMMMSASRARQSVADFPRATTDAKIIVLVGGRGRLGALYERIFRSSGHETRVLDADDWPDAAGLLAGADAVIVTVPIRETSAVIDRLAPLLDQRTILADFTSNKQVPLARMLAAFSGPVVGLHPMHGSDVENLSKQLMIVCPGRDAHRSEWLLRQFELWGMRLKELAPGKHDQTMHLVQGLRHFVALLHGSFMRAGDLRPDDILELSSPIYRAELMMTCRIFAQNAELYADIVFADPERRRLLLDFWQHHGRLAELVRNDDKEGFCREFEAIGKFCGDFAEEALRESGYLIHRLADRFV